MANSKNRLTNRCGEPRPAPMTNSQHAYEIRPREDHRGADLISDALPFRSAVVTPSQTQLATPLPNENQITRKTGHVEIRYLDIVFLPHPRFSNGQFN